MSSFQQLFSYFGGTTYDQFRFDSDDTLQLTLNNGNSANTKTSAVFRDPSAWYHIVALCDTTNATANDRLQLWVNGVRQSLGTNTQPTQNYDTYVNTTNAFNIGRLGSGGSHFDGYLTEVNFIDGQALTASSFGQIESTTGVWSPKQYVGSYGTNGFYLKFGNTSSVAALGTDSSGNGNTWTVNSVSLTAGATYDSMLDVPVNYSDSGNGRGNYAVLNSIRPSTGVVSDANLTVTTGTTSTKLLGTIGMSSGKWYWECALTNATGGGLFGIALADSISTTHVGVDAFSWGYSNNAERLNNNVVISYGATWTTNDIIGVAFDADLGSLTFYKNGSSQGVAFSGLASNTYFAAFGDANAVASSVVVANFGQRPFTYTPPAGFKALNTNNLPTPSIVNGANFMAATTYTGNAAARSLSNAVNNVSFQPDLVWIKSRTPGATSHALFDSSRGVTKYLSSNTTTAETTLAQSLTALNADGFSLGTDTTLVNASANSYIAWQWRESITAGLDIVTYTGNGANRTIAHNLGVAPKMVIVRCLNSSFSTSWIVWHAAFLGTEYIQLNVTSGKQSDATIWNSAAPSSTVFSVGTANATNESTKNLIAYCFAEIAGFSKFGSYTGNGLADGPFVFCGFRPRFVLIKRSDPSTENWWILDTSRDPYNTLGNALFPNLPGTESPGYTFDFLSNGFKIRTYINSTGGTYIFAAFAEVPSKYALAR